jgi:thiosulfate dehydrogenase
VNLKKLGFSGSFQDQWDFSCGMRFETEVARIMFRFLVGIVIGLVLAPAAVLGWFKYGHPPVAVADSPLPFEKQIVRVPMHARIDSQMPSSVPIEPTAGNFLAGAQVYRDQCAACHGFHGKPSDFAAHMYPQAPQLWRTHRDGKTVGVSDDPPGETYWKVANGLRLTGMPAYDKILTDTQIWQVTVLLANADKPLPPEVVRIVNGQSAAISPEGITPVKPAEKKK